MKAKYLFLIGCIFSILFINNTAAQNNRKIERIVNGQTYIIDNNFVINKKNLLPNGRNKTPGGEQCYYFEVEDGFTTLTGVFKKVFLSERMNELIKSKASVGLLIRCFSSGKIDTVSFLFSKNICFSLFEIQLLEEELEKTYLKIKTTCSGNFYFFITIRYKFEKYAQTP